MYSYQFTQARPRLAGIYPWLLHMALTDVQAGKHSFTQRLTFWHPEVYVTGDSVHFKSLAHLQREADRMLLTMHGDTALVTPCFRFDKARRSRYNAAVILIGGEIDALQPICDVRRS